jgi:hypothetical protein
MHMYMHMLYVAQHTRLAPYPNESRLNSLHPAFSRAFPNPHLGPICPHLGASQTISLHLAALSLSCLTLTALRLAGRRIHIAAYQPLHGFSVAAFCSRSLAHLNQSSFRT